MTGTGRLLSASITTMREAQQKNARIHLVSNRDRGSTAKTGFAPPRNWASTSIRLLPLSRCSTAERLCPLLPARTERRDYSGREPAKSRALGNADSRCSRGTRLARATEESTLALKTGPLLFPGVAHRPHDGWRLWPQGCPLGRIEHRTVHRTAAEERAKPRLPSFLPVEGTPWIRIRRL